MYWCRVPGSQLLEQGHAELAKRTHFFQKLVKKLNEKVQLQEERERVMAEAGLGPAGSVGGLRGSEAERTLVSLKREASELSKALEEANAATRAAESTAGDLKKQLDHVQALQDDAVWRGSGARVALDGNAWRADARWRWLLCV